ncbi:hypothetical protein LCGC14_2244380 [marine sediment metagenome]|uniref:Uncharacterized protein n=1 Tax=marine sediment metagenome TaxID=412755 RepID=A0A0F9DS30_9ZZZZ
MNEIKIKIKSEMKEGSFLYEINVLIKEMKNKGLYGPYLIISTLEIELKAKQILYDMVFISEFKRILEKREILDWNGWKYSNELDEARELEPNLLILRQCSKEDLRHFNENKIKIEIKEIKEKLDKINEIIRLL